MHVRAINSALVLNGLRSHDLLQFLCCRIMSFATGEVAAILKRPELYLTDVRPMIVIALSGVCSL
jgi:hypothetical protein